MNEDTIRQTHGRNKMKTIIVKGWKTAVRSRPRIRKRSVDGYYVTVRRVYPLHYTGDMQMGYRYHIETDDRKIAETEAIGLHCGLPIQGLKYEKRYQ